MIICVCGKEEVVNFYTCDGVGRVVSPIVEGSVVGLFLSEFWDGVHYVCKTCKTIIDSRTLEVVGHCSSEVAAYIDGFDWDEY